MMRFFGFKRRRLERVAELNRRAEVTHSKTLQALDAVEKKAAQLKRAVDRIDGVTIIIVEAMAGGKR